MKTLKLALPLMAASFLLTACGGDDNDNNNPEPTAVPSTTPTPTLSCSDGLPPFVSCVDGSGSEPDVYTISGDITEDFTVDMSSDKEWRMSGTVRVGNGNTTEVTTDADVTALQTAGVTLTIEPGVHIHALGTAKLIVTRGSKIMADGERDMPITFSSLDEGYDGTGEWAGVVVQGFAPQYGGGDTGACYGTGTTCNIEGEGGTDIGYYGGSIEDDNSGVIRYVRIAEAGQVAGLNNEVNGLTLQGVGYGTTVEYVQIHGNLDDGIEWFGGTVNVKYAVLTNNDDDDIDFDEGYVGNIQHVLIVKDQSTNAVTGDNDPRGIEANSNGAEKYVPQTNAVLANFTIIGSGINNQPGNMQPGMRLRGAVNVEIHNSVVEGFDAGCVEINDEANVNSNVVFSNVIGHCANGFYKVDRPADESDNVLAQVATFDDAYAVVEAQADLGTMSAITAVGNSSFTFDSTDYIGAVAPGTTPAEAWWAGWTIPGSLSEVGVPAEADFVSCADNVCTLSGVIDEDYTLIAGIDWRLSGTVRVGRGNTTQLLMPSDVEELKASGVTLTIDPGVSVKALGSGKLLVTRGNKIMANGTKYAPITFSSLDADYDGEGEWGGVVIQGLAPQYGQGDTGPCYGSGTTCNVTGEGGSEIGVYGGNDPADDSGVFRYVRIAEAGQVAGLNNEVNGLTLQGVGHGTEIEYVQIHGNLDDGIEWFGGTVNVKYAVLTNNDDDDLDFDEGYMGNIQHVLIIKNQTATALAGNNDPRGIEANSSNADYVPQTSAVLANITVIGSDIVNLDGNEQPGMRLRGSVTVDIYNSAVTGFDDGCIRIDQSEVSDTLTVDTPATLVNILTECESGAYKSGTPTAASSNVVELATMTFDDAFAITEAQAQLTVAPTITAMDNGSGFAFDQTDYVGAVAPGTAASEAWWAGWTIDWANN
ncbi:hypothetical protein [Teredinibacter turnerae]|uniref:hypothetical protein n=1 Tax=Teredinibacter turnerae TaxID=2426 RepID=UPI0005F85465|nr:hypothetical protein [Teredinibacter turnerae]